MREPDLKAEPRARRGSSLLGELHANPAASGDRASPRLRVQAAMAPIIGCGQPVCKCPVYTPDAGKSWLCLGLPNLGTLVPTLGLP